MEPAPYGEARARIVAEAPYRLLVILKTNHGDYHELRAIDLADAYATAGAFCHRNNLHLAECSADDDCRAINCNAEVPIRGRIEAARERLERRSRKTSKGAA